MTAEPSSPKRTPYLSVATIGAIALMATLAALPGASAATVVVSPTDLDGWQARHGTCGAATTGNQTFELGPVVPPLGTGSLQISVGSNGDSFETFRHSGFNGTLLSDLTSLSYSTYTQVDGTGGQAIYIILAVSTTGGNSVDQLLFFEPVYQSGHNASIPDQGSLEDGQWQSWDALAGGWWSPQGFGAGAGANVRPLDEYIAQFPDASLVDGAFGGIRLATGCGGEAWAGFVGNVDNVTIGRASDTTTYDFEPVSPATSSTTGTTTSSSTTTTEIPFFPTWAALGIAVVASLGGAFLLARRRVR